jgi:copper(I)-binding protein
MIKNTKYILVLLVSMLLVSACSSGGELSVKDAWARPGMAGGNSAVYFTLDNPASEDDVLLEAEGSVAERVELHLSKMEEGVMKMQQQESIPVPAESTVEFAPGGLHVMLIGLEDELKVGDSFPLTLRFQNVGEIRLEIPVQEE